MFALTYNKKYTVEKTHNEAKASVEGSMDMESNRDELAEIEKVERVYRKLDFRIIPGT